MSCSPEEKSIVLQPDKGLNVETSESYTNLRSNFKLIGHRGGVVNTLNIENSLLALNEAIKRAYDMVEIDIHFTSDGLPVIHHNSDLSNLYGETTPIESLTMEKIQNIKTVNSGVLPYSLEEFAIASDGTIGFLLDFKGNGYSNFYYDICIDILKRNNISNVKIAWSKEAKNIFTKKRR